MVERVLYGTSFNRDLITKEIVYRQMIPYEKVLQHGVSKTFLHKNSSRDHVMELGRYVMYHMLTRVPFNLPHVIYNNLIMSIKNLHKDMF